MRFSPLVVMVSALAACFVLRLLSGQAMAQEAGYFRTMVGSLPVVALSDAKGAMGRALLRDATDNEINFSLAKAGLSLDADFPSFVNAFLVELPGGLALVDTGNGPGHNLPKSLAEAGVKPDDVKAVLLTHFHGDHIGGLLDSEGKAFFKSAVVYADEAEDAYWLVENPSDRAVKALAPYKASGRYKTFKAGDEVIPGVASLDLKGHTPGHAGFLFDGGGGNILLAWGDIVHIRFVQFDYPKAYLTYDTDPAGAVAARERIFAEASGKGWIVAGAHLPFPGLATLAKGSGGGYDYRPADGQ